MQTLVVLFIVIISAVYLIRYVIKSFKKNGGKGCSGCSKD